VCRCRSTAPPPQQACGMSGRVARGRAACTHTRTRAGVRCSAACAHRCVGRTRVAVCLGEAQPRHYAGTHVQHKWCVGGGGGAWDSTCPALDCRAACLASGVCQAAVGAILCGVSAVFGCACVACAPVHARSGLVGPSWVLGTYLGTQRRCFVISIPWCWVRGHLMHGAGAAGLFASCLSLCRSI
jgi:hypothetical protein